MRRLLTLAAAAVAFIAPSTVSAQEIYVGRDGVQYYQPRGGYDSPRYYDDDQDDYRYSRRQRYRDDDQCTPRDAVRAASRRYGLRNVRVGRTGNQGTEIFGIGRRGERVRMWVSTEPGCPRL